LPHKCSPNKILQISLNSVENLDTFKYASPLPLHSAVQDFLSPPPPSPPPHPPHPLHLPLPGRTY
jgi:hypothetical protein